MSILSYFSLKSWVGDYTKDELKKFMFLSFIFSLTIGIYWFLRTDKDGVFNVIVGYKWAPIAKWISMALMLILTGFYGFLISKLQKHQIFYVFAAIYGFAAILFSFFLSHSTIGIANTIADPMRFIGWAYYLYVESYGSLWVVLFWTFATDTTSPEVAKRWFPFMSFIAQCGSWTGSAFTKGRFGKFPVDKSLIGAALIMVLVAILIYIFMRVIPANQLKAYGEKSGKEEEKKRLSFFESAKAVFSQPYLIGIFLSITLYEIINTLFDYRLKSLISSDVENSMKEYSGLDAKELGEMKRFKFNEWTGWVGENMALVGIISYIFGLGNVGRKFGFMVSVMLFPSMLLILALIVGLSKIIIVVASACVLLKGLNYAFYQPVKEQLYIPTTKDARYKSKGFIEMVGSRGSKAFASGINFFDLWMPVYFPIISFVSCIALSIVWLGYSRYLGKTYVNAVAKNETIC